MVTNAQRFIQRMYPSARTRRVMGQLVLNIRHFEVWVNVGERAAQLIGMGATENDAWRDAYRWHQIQTGKWRGA